MIFLKLGGSLITDKAIPETPRLETLARLAEEVALAAERLPPGALVIGHGSGSFGHTAASRYGTHSGAHTREDWHGFAEVWSAANRLNRIVVDAFRKVGLPAISLPPSASAICDEGEIQQMAVEPIRKAVEAGLLPVLQGDVAFDLAHGSAIISTEQVFSFLAAHLQPERLLLAGLEPGVFRDFERKNDILPILTAADLDELGLMGSGGVDVTGGMADKVQRALELARSYPALEIRIFSGAVEGNLLRALRGEAIGTLVRSH